MSVSQAAPDAPQRAGILNSLRETNRRGRAIAPRAGYFTHSLFLLSALLFLILPVGCAEKPAATITYYCDGAGWYSSAGSVEAGLRAAGYQGQFHTFSWSSYLGAGPDHFINAGSKLIARGLTHKIEKARQQSPHTAIHVMGLSAGTSIVLNAIEQLPSGVSVNNVVLFSPSVSSLRNLTPIMQHVRGRLYATTSESDGILSTLAVNADGKSGRPAGLVGFQMTSRPSAEVREAYSRVVNLPWRAGYLPYDWNGGHTTVTNRDFVRAVIAPRVLGDEPYPLDRSVADRFASVGGLQ